MPSSINLASLGRRVREARLARKLTLEAVVARTNFTISWLSKLENGQLSPSLDGLAGLAEALGCGVETLVEGLTVPPRHVVVRSGNGQSEHGATRKPSRNGRGRAVGTNVENLVNGWQGAAMQPVILHLGSSDRQRPESVDAQRFLMVLEGRARLEYDNDAILLEAGDSIYFDASFPHTISNASRGSARVLSITPATAAPVSAG
jgi:quercetin dioxygenase-like cupin family protein